MLSILNAITLHITLKHQFSSSFPPPDVETLHALSIVKTSFAFLIAPAPCSLPSPQSSDRAAVEGGYWR
jgi:hypothetical protein